jgi:hypothetical protein
MMFPLLLAAAIPPRAYSYPATGIAMPISRPCDGPRNRTVIRSGSVVKAQVNGGPRVGQPRGGAISFGFAEHDSFVGAVLASKPQAVVAISVCEKDLAKARISGSSDRSMLHMQSVGRGRSKWRWPVASVTLKNRTVAPMVQLFIQGARTLARYIKVPMSSGAGAQGDDRL